MTIAHLLVPATFLACINTNIFHKVLILSMSKKCMCYKKFVLEFSATLAMMALAYNVLLLYSDDEKLNASINSER